MYDEVDPMKTALVLAVAIAVSGCTIAMKDYLTTDYQIGTAKTVTVGSPMFTVISGSKYSHSGEIINEITEEIFYGGVSGNTLWLSYQEFTYPLARPTFSQELQYDLARSRTIKFRDYTMQIDSADNSTITFRVLEGPAVNVPSSTYADSLSTDTISIGIVLANREVVSLKGHSIADKSGIHIGDVILSVDGIDLTGETNHDLKIVNASLGIQREYSVQRGNRVITIIVTMPVR